MDTTLMAWQEYDADRALPMEYRRYPPAPAESREVLRERQRELVAQLARIS